MCLCSSSSHSSTTRLHCSISGNKSLGCDHVGGLGSSKGRCGVNCSPGPDGSINGHGGGEGTFACGSNADSPGSNSRVNQQAATQDAGGHGLPSNASGHSTGGGGASHGSTASLHGHTSGNGSASGNGVGSHGGGSSSSGGGNGLVGDCGLVDNSSGQLSPAGLVGGYTSSSNGCGVGYSSGTNSGTCQACTDKTSSCETGTSKASAC